MFCLRAWLVCVLALTVMSQEPVIDLSKEIYSGAGIGFSFSNANGTAAGIAMANSTLSGCTIEALDALYFYVYGCKVPSSFVNELVAKIPTFQYTSDKSLTLRTVSKTSMLVANEYNMTLHYAAGREGQTAAAICEIDLLAVKRRSGECVWLDGCAATRVAPYILVGCGSLSCEGCDLDNFFTQFQFTLANFHHSQPAQ